MTSFPDCRNIVATMNLEQMAPIWFWFLYWKVQIKLLIMLCLQFLFWEGWTTLKWNAALLMSIVLMGFRYFSSINFVFCMLCISTSNIYLVSRIILCIAVRSCDVIQRRPSDMEVFELVKGRGGSVLELRLTHLYWCRSVRSWHSYSRTCCPQ